ncbi:Insulin protein enhancer protein isl-1 [Homalodisca vitripennis]|nr:Insulin protein enhancer protein isl-1 [Homalodisca vitripennis]
MGRTHPNGGVCFLALGRVTAPAPVNKMIALLLRVFHPLSTGKGRITFKFRQIDDKRSCGLILQLGQYPSALRIMEVNKYLYDEHSCYCRFLPITLNLGVIRDISGVNPLLLRADTRGASSCGNNFARAFAKLMSGRVDKERGKADTFSPFPQNSPQILLGIYGTARWITSSQGFLLFGTKCDKCNQSFSKNDFVMRAKTKIYHIECFRCSACERQLIPGDEFALREDGLFCKEDHEVLEKATNGENNNNNTNLSNNNSLHHNEGSNSGESFSCSI